MVMFNAMTYDPNYRRPDGSTGPAIRWLDGQWREKSDFYKCGLREEITERKLRNICGWALL